MKGFTLIEIIVATVIIMLLASISVPLGEMVYSDAKQDEVVVSLKDVRAAIEEYHKKTGSYPRILPGENIIDALNRTLVKTGLLAKLPENPATKSVWDWQVRDSVSDKWYNLNAVNSGKSLPIATAIFDSNSYDAPTNIYDIRFPKDIKMKKDNGKYYYEF
jgi:prepilin-type N-terminal cleavage/methylation domain-containing protein